MLLLFSCGQQYFWGDIIWLLPWSHAKTCPLRDPNVAESNTVRLWQLGNAIVTHVNTSVFQLLGGSGIANLDTKITRYLISFIFFHSGFGLWETLHYISFFSGIWKLWKKSLNNKHIECNKYYCVVEKTFYFFYFCYLWSSWAHMEDVRLLCFSFSS